ncbi:hypothetical protein BH09MYX1_BH09MYX1_39150 [soil metagenome]
MAEALAAIADRLFRSFLAPLVLGGELRPGRPIGAKTALALGGQLLTDSDLASHVELARLRIARKIVPLDHFLNAEAPGTPNGEEWALAAALHDIVQAAHPDWNGVLRSSQGPTKLLDLAAAALDHVGPVSDVREALARHTWFSRVLEIARTDTKVSWWVGSQTFLGIDPPHRLSAWPELRRVRVEKETQPLLDLPGAGGKIDANRFGVEIARFLRASPLPDLSKCARTKPHFSWTPETISLVAMRGGRTLALRAIRTSHPLDVDVALGRAMRAIVLRKALQPATIVLGFLGERMLGLFEEIVNTGAALAETNSDDAIFARAIGAYGARQLLETSAAQYSARDLALLRRQISRHEIRGQIEPVAGLLGLPLTS